MLLLVLPFISCKKPCGCTNISVDFTLSYQNSTGADLLNPASANAIKAEDIDAFILKNGVKTRLYQGNLDAPKFFKISKDNNETNYRMIVYFETNPEDFNGDRITQYIKYKDGTEDEFVGEFYHKGNNTSLLKLWINGVLQGDPSLSSQKPLVIIK
jgi:hypothetical protein